MGESNFLKGRSWTYFFLGQAPSTNFRLLRRRFQVFSEHDIQVSIRLIEELFKIYVIHQHNPHD